MLIFMIAITNFLININTRYIRLVNEIRVSFVVEEVEIDKTL